MTERDELDHEEAKKKQEQLEVAFSQLLAGWRNHPISALIINVLKRNRERNIESLLKHPATIEDLCKLRGMVEAIDLFLNLERWIYTAGMEDEAVRKRVEEISYGE